MNALEPASILARVSTDEQAEDGYGLPRQIDAGLHYVKQRGYALETRVGYASEGVEYRPGVFQEDYTGKVALRPAVIALLDAMKSYSVKIVVIHRTSRLGRRGSVQEVLEAEFRARGARVEYVTAQFDTTTPTGRAMRRVTGVFDELDYENIIEQLKEGKVQKVKTGSVMANRPPYGYEFIKVKAECGKTITQLQINEDEAEAVRLIFLWYVYGDESGEPLSIKEIAMRLKAVGAPLRHANRKANGFWSTSHIFDILRSETYVGRWYYHKTLFIKDPETNKQHQMNRPRADWIEVSVPAVVNEDVFKLARERAARNLEQAKRNRKHTYLFSGMMRCMTCGQRFAGRLMKHTTKKFYCCGLRSRAILPFDCPKWDYSETDIDRAVWEWLTDMVTHPEKVEQTLLARQAEAEDQTSHLREHLSAIERIIEQKRGEQTNLIRLYAKNPLPPLEVEITHLQREIDDHDQERSRIAAQLAGVNYTPEYIADIKEVCARIARGLAVFTAEERRQTYEMLELSIKLTIEDGYQIAYAECVIHPNEQRLPIAPSDIAFGSSSQSDLPAAAGAHPRSAGRTRAVHPGTARRDARG